MTEGLLGLFGVVQGDADGEPVQGAAGGGGVSGRDAIGLGSAHPPAEGEAGASQVDLGDLLGDPQADHLAGDGVGRAHPTGIEVGAIDLAKEQHPGLGVDPVGGVAQPLLGVDGGGIG